VENGRRGWI